MGVVKELNDAPYCLIRHIVQRLALTSKCEQIGSQLWLMYHGVKLSKAPPPGNFLLTIDPFRSLLWLFLIGGSR